MLSKRRCSRDKSTEYVSVAPRLSHDFVPISREPGNEFVPAHVTWQAHAVSTSSFTY